MSFALAIRDALGERRFDLTDFPLTIGGAGCVVALAGSFSGAVAYLGVHDEELFMQPAEGQEITHNGVPARGSVWLKAGDVINIGTARLRLAAGEGLPVLAVEDGSLGNITAPPVIDLSSRVSGASDVDEERLEAVNFRAQPGMAVAQRRSFHPRRVLLVMIAMVFAAIFWFISTSVTLTVAVDPAPAPGDDSAGADRIELTGGLPALDLGSRFLLRPGNYQLSVERAGFRPVTRDVEVTDTANQILSVALEKLPGILRIEVPDEAVVRIDDVERGPAPGDFELEPGRHVVNIKSPRYQEFTGEVAIEGAGATQTYAPELVPAWALVSVATEPAGAQLLVDGEVRGVTPLQTEVVEGSHTLELQLEGYKPWTSDLRVRANEAQTIGPVRMGLPDGRLVVRSNPSGASVTLGGAYRGQTPVELEVRPDISQTLVLARPGYEPVERSVSVGPGARQVVEVGLTGIYGEIAVTAQPADAIVYVNGEARGVANQKLRLTANPHEIEIRKPGFESHRVTVTPRPGLPQAVNVTLLTPEASKVAAMATVIRAKAGPELRLMPAGRYTMGSPRREPGRRANEGQREVELRRRFYLGTREITNAEYRQFRPDHRSGFVKANTLELDRQPVVNVTWQQAAAYCNWLSSQEGLPAAYETKDGSLVPVAPANTGYRLPTEAEWEWSARYEGGNAVRRYPWGDALPVAPRSGNYADYTARIVVQDVIPEYDDGYAATAPVGSYAANGLGLYDMGGNVAEWTQDLYTVTMDSGAVALDPVGTGDGTQRVIRGSSWRQSGVTDLRLAARDFGTGARNDLGFRIARYVE